MKRVSEIMAAGCSDRYTSDQLAQFNWRDRVVSACGQKQGSVLGTSTVSGVLVLWDGYTAPVYVLLEVLQHV